MRVIIDGHRVEVDTEKLAKAIAISYADWHAFTGRAEKLAKDLPGILRIERELF